MPIRLLLPPLLFLLGTSTAPADPFEARARDLVNALGCKACHRLNGQGGSLGPELNTIGSRLTPGMIRARLQSLHGPGGPATMPSYTGLTEDDREVLVLHLVSLKR